MICLLLVLAITVIAGAYPFAKKIKSQKGHDFPTGEALAAGIFLGAGLMHMLGDASSDFLNHGITYPLAFLLCGGVFLLLLFFEHLAKEIYHHQGEQGSAFAVLATLMLSIHSLLAGAALGLSDTYSIAIIILLAILAHKWAASFALAIHLNKSTLSFKQSLILFSTFALMLPLGVVLGTSITATLHHHPLLEPIFSSLAAGTFLYLGTLHGLEKATLVKSCCDLRRFSLVIFGFVIMAVVAIWV